MKHFNKKSLLSALLLAITAIFAAMPAHLQASPHPYGPMPATEGDEPEYSVQYSLPVVTDASQFYCNNLSTEGSLANLIDGDYQTHFISAYNESRVTNTPDEYHYLQVYAADGLPERFIIHWRTRANEWSNMYRPIHIVLSVSVDGTEWTEIGEWQNPEAGFPVTADVPEYDSPVITLDGEYNYFRITVLEVNSPDGISTDGHPFFNFAEYNLYPVVVKGEETLADVLNSMSLSPDDYQYGTDPGFINDYDKWQNFYDLYLKAMQYVNDGTHSDEEMDALKEQFVAAEEDIRNSIIPIKEGGYYYITTANPKFTGNSKENYGWYAPTDEQNHIGWKALEESSKFVWKFTKNDDGSYMIQNMLTGLYVDSTQVNALSQVPYLAELPAHKQLVKNLTYAGVFSLEWDGAVAVYHQDGHADGAGESGNIVLWNGQAGSPSSWFLREVPDDIVQKLIAQRELDLLKNYLDMNPDLLDNYSVGTMVGQLNDQAAYDRIKAAYETAVAAIDETHTPEEYAAYLTELKAAIADAEANYTNPLKEGYYRFVVANPYFLDQEDETLHTLSWAQHPSNTSVIEWSKDDGTADYIWKVTFTEKDTFYIQNMSTYRYISCGTVLARGNNINSTAEPVTKHYLDFMGRNGVVNVYNTTYTEYPYHALNWNMAYNGTICYAEGDPSRWYMVEVPTEEAEQIIAETLNRNRLDTLKSLISTAEGKILDTDIPVYDYDDPVVTDANNLYSNAQAYTANEQTSYENLIDGDYGTIFHSRYNSLEPIDDYHYLRVYAPDGLPDKFGIHWAKRCFNANESNNAACRPTKIAIALSNDGETWEHPDTLTTADGLPTITTDTFYTSKKPIDGTGYTYFIMKVLEVNDNFAMSDGFGHPFFTMSEYNLYPYTGSNPASQINDPEIKAIVDELQAAITKAEEVIESGTVGEGDVPALQAAYDKLLNAWKDTTELGRLLAENVMFSELVEGDGSVVGDAPYDAIEKIAGIVNESGLTEKPLYTLSKSEIESNTATMKAAQKEFLNSITKPEEGVWYVIQTAEDFPERADKIMNAGGWYAHTPTNGNQYSYWLDQYTTADVETNTRAAFIFRANEDGTLTMQNVGSGFFLGPETGSGNTTYDYRPIQWYEPHSVQLIPFGDGQVGFRLESGRYIRGNAAWYADGMTYEFNEGNKPLAYSAFAWQVYPVSDICSQITETQDIAQGRVIAITKPHDLESLPTAEYGTVQGYRIVGKLTEEGSSDSIITAYKLQKYPDGEVIPAGTPIIYITEGESYNADVSYNVEFKPYMDGKVTNVPATVNGLAGNIDSYRTEVDHYGYFLNDSVVDEPAGILIGYNRATIVPWLVEEVPDAQVDMIVYVQGAGMLNDIKDVVIEDQKEKVDVYSIDGVLIRRNVARTNATNGLAKDIYIVGKQKVLVK